MSEEIPELPVSHQETQIQAPSFSDKLKIHKFKILFGILVTFLLAGTVFAGYQLGRQGISFEPPGKATPTPLVTPFPTPTPDLTVDWQTYTSKKNGFEVKYPSSWGARQFSEQLLWVYPEKGQTPNTIPSYLVTVSSYPFDSSFKTSKDLWSKAKQEKEVSGLSLTILEEGGIRVSEHEAYQVLLKSLDPDPRPPTIYLVDRYIYLVYGDRAVSIGCGEWISEEEFNQKNFWPQYGNTFNLILSTFRFLPSGEPILPKEEVNLPSDCLEGTWKGSVKRCTSSDIPLYNPGRCKSSPYLLQLEDGSTVAFKNDEDFENLEEIIGKQLVLIGCMPGIINVTEGGVIYLTEIIMGP